MGSNILTIDIGGSGIKATVLDEKGVMLTEYQKKSTPEKPTPVEVIKVIRKLVANFPGFDKISVGFPGYVNNGKVYTAPNLGTELWKNSEFAQIIANEFNKPVRLLNDADLQGFGLIEGKGMELVLTLGTGLGTALFIDGIALPHLELSHFNVRKNKDFDAFIGNAALEKDGEEKWNKKLKEVIKTFKIVVNYNKLYLSGGNAKKVNFKIPENIQICGNRDGIKGGALLWKKEGGFSLKTIKPTEQTK